LKKEDLNSYVPPEKRFRIDDESPPSTDDEEDNKINNNNNNNTNNANNTDKSNAKILDSNNDTEDENSSSSSHNDNQNLLSKPYSLLANNTSAHVRSCARFPLLSQGLKIANQFNSNLISKNCSPSLNGNKPEVKGLAALMTSRKKNESSRDRLFKSLKGII